MVEKEYCGVPISYENAITDGVKQYTSLLGYKVVESKIWAVSFDYVEGLCKTTTLRRVRWDEDGGKEEQSWAKSKHRGDTLYGIYGMVHSWHVCCTLHSIHNPDP